MTYQTAQKTGEDVKRPDMLLLDGSEVLQMGSPRHCECNVETIDFKLDILGKMASFRIGVAQGQAGLADIVPLARTFSTKLVLMVLDRLREDGEVVPCRKGCSACCSYLIPLSVPEVFCLREEFLTMPAKHKTAVLQACFDTAKTILDKRLREFGIDELAKKQQLQIGRLSKWYAGFKLSCPFLSDGLCMIYEQRPLACCEHIVTGSAVSCGAEETNEPEVVRMPVSVLEALGQLTAVLESSEIEAVMLPLALPWAQDNIQRSKRTWPAVTMVEHFVAILKAMASENSAVVTSATSENFRHSQIQS